jgi:hypothetical protein
MTESMTVEELMEQLRGAVPLIDNEDIGSLLNVGSFKYYCVMRTHIDNGTCPFCPNGFDPTLNRIIGQNDHCMFWENPVGKGDPALEKHYVFALKDEHRTDITTLSPAQRLAFMDLMIQAVERLNIPGGAIVMRFGQAKRNAGSLRHIHANILVPFGNQRYTATLAKDEADLRSKAAKIFLWEKMYQAKKDGVADPESILSEEERAFLAKK